MMMTATGTTGITDIADVLSRLGVKVKRVGEKEISACCPVHEKHTGKADNSPSWSMNARSGLWICYSCGAKGTLSTLVSELTGEPDSIIAVHTFLIETGLERLTTEPVEVLKPVVDWKVFSSFSAPSDHVLWTRGIDRESARKYGIRYDDKRQAWILPMVSPMGGCLVGKRKNHQRFVTIQLGLRNPQHCLVLTS